MWISIGIKLSVTEDVGDAATLTASGGGVNESLMGVKGTVRGTLCGSGLNGMGACGDPGAGAPMEGALGGMMNGTNGHTGPNAQGQAAWQWGAWRARPHPRRLAVRPRPR